MIFMSKCFKARDGQGSTNARNFVVCGPRTCDEILIECCWGLCLKIFGCNNMTYTNAPINSKQMSQAKYFIVF